MSNTIETQKILKNYLEMEIISIAKFKPEERQAYEESLKHYRDLKNVIDTSFLEGKELGLEEGMEKGAREKALEGVWEISINWNYAGSNYSSR